MVIYLFNLSSENLNIRIHLKPGFVLIRSLLWSSSCIIWKMSSNKLNFEWTKWLLFFFYWELSKVLASFINLAYWVLSQTYKCQKTCNDFHSFACICNDLAEFFCKNSFQPPACSGLIPGWKRTSLLISLPRPICFTGSSATDHILQKQNTEWEARSFLLSKTPVH